MNDVKHDKSRLKFQRTLTPSQIDQLVQLFQAEWWTRDRTRTDVEKILQLEGPIFAFIDPSNEDLVAFARILTDGVYKAMIFDIIVKSTWRKTGLGRMLIEAVINDPAIINVKHHELYCLKEMIPFYEKWGFTAELPGLFFMRKSN